MKRRGAAVALAIATLGFCLLLAECVLDAAQILESPPQLTRGHPRRGYQLRAGYEGVTKFGVHLRVNARGLRSPDFEIPKPVGTHRVLVLGDSVTFGWGVEEEQNFSRRLERALRSRLACPVEVVNSGVSGYGTVEEADYFSHEGLDLEPDVVLIYYVENDNQSVAHVGGPMASFLKDWVVYRSQLVSTVLYAWRLGSWKAQAQAAGGDRAAYAAEQRAWDQRPGTAASMAALREIADVAKRHGIRVILASHPNSLADRSLDAVRDRLLREAAAANGMIFVDIAPAIVPYRDRDIAVSKTDLHPNGFAHGLIAEALLPAVQGALDCPLATSAVH